MEPKKYGLIIPKKEKKEIVTKLNLFQKDGSDDESINAKPKISSISKSDKFIKKQAQLNIEKALNEDPNCFEYDGVYEDMQANKFLAKASIITDKKPKYIEKLMKTAQERKREYERRVERKVQKDREAEKGMYDDKEAYVTDAYKKKMQMLKEEEEMERRKQLIEEQQDVTKKSDFCEFYRHILDQQTMIAAKPPDNIPHIKQEVDILQSAQSIEPVLLPAKTRDVTNTAALNDDDADDSDVNDDASDDVSDDEVDDVINKNNIGDDVNAITSCGRDTEAGVKVNSNLKLPSDSDNLDNKPKHNKRTVGESLSDAKARYLARKDKTFVPIYNN